MTEDEWHGCTEPLKMLEFLRGKVSSRKLRLFACTCCRSIWHLLAESNGRDAVELSEHYADGVVGREELAKARRNVANACTAHHDVLLEAIHAAKSCAAKYPFVAAREASLGAGHTVGLHHAITTLDAAELEEREIYLREELAGRQKEYVRQCQFLTDIFANPFRPVAVDPSWLAWNDGTVVKLAQGIYDDRAFDRLPILADAVEEAGCNDPHILAHCREPGQHVRGCWAVDLLLGKE